MRREEAEISRHTAFAFRALASQPGTQLLRGLADSKLEIGRRALGECRIRGGDLLHTATTKVQRESIPMNLNEFFPHQVCINLDKRADRWERIQSRFVEHRINRVVRFPALDGKTLAIPHAWNYSPGAYGCLRSHLAVVEQARENAQPSVLIFEDDAVLAPEFNAKFADYVTQLPGDWDMVFFGAIHGQPLTNIADNVIRVSHSLSTYAYALKHTVYDGFIEVNRKEPSVLDENTRALQKLFNCYCFMPHLAWVEEDYSDISEENINLWWLKESLVLFGPEIDEILRNTIVIVSYRNRGRSSLRNLTFTLDYLSRTLPHITLVVLEQGQKASLRRTDLPPFCQLEFVGDIGGNGEVRSRVLNGALEIFGSSKDFFVFLDTDVFLTRDDIKANLLKCCEHDVASSFREIRDLSEADTLRVLNGDMRWDRNVAYQSRKKEGILDSSCIITRKGMRILGNAVESGGRSDGETSTRTGESLRVFESPNLARRLSSG